MTYEESLGFIMGLLEADRRPRLPGRETNLRRIDRLMTRLGRPERDLRTVLVAGTKGKGSTAAMLAAVEEGSGRRVGLYVKPHLVDYRERIRVNGALIDETDLAALVEEMRPQVEAGANDPEGIPTYFEVSVALALLYFSRRAVDLAILEVGLGGRLDATNICDPLLSVITPVSYDHMEVLGRTLPAIAREKAGIIRPGRPVVTAPQPPEVEETLEKVCAEAGARRVRVPDRARWRHGAMSPEGQAFHLLGAHDYGWVHLSLVGRHQAENAATAVTSAEELVPAGFPLPPEAVRQGLASLRWPGRVEVVARHPAVIVDVAHNEASMQALRDALLEVWPGRKIILVFGMVARHDPEGPCAVIAPIADAVIVTLPRHIQPLPASRVAEAVRPYTSHVEIVEDRAAAVERALALARGEDVVCVTGSFYLAGEARASLLAGEARVALLAGEARAAGAKEGDPSPFKEGDPSPFKEGDPSPFKEGSSPSSSV
jgi:dihydrofolate synthase/folylpolyglutamate synthase